MPQVWRSGSLGLLVAALAALGASAATPCSQIQEPQLSEAVAEARRYLAERWLEVGNNLYIAYRMKSPAANPFDLTRPKEEKKGKANANAKDSEEGYIWVGNLQCQLSGTQDDEVVVSFIAGAASFVEKKGAWTPPLRQRELTQIVVTKRNSQWVASERRGDYSLLAADDELRRPTATEIPSRNKRLGIPCEANQAWNGKRCVTTQRAGAKQP